MLCTAFAIGLGRVQRGATSLAYWGIFSDTEYCGSENSLISYGIFFWKYLRAAASVLLPTSSALAFSVAASSALRIGLASPALSALPIGLYFSHTGSRSNPCIHDSTATCQAPVPRTSLSNSHRLSVLPYRCQENCLSVHRSPIGFQPLRDWIPSSV